MSRRITAIIFRLFVTVVLLSVGYQLRAQQRGDVYSSNPSDRRNSSRQRECTCPLGIQSPMWEVEMARVRPYVEEIQERESRLEERQQREWRIEVDGAGRGGSQAAAAARERVQARQQREQYDFQIKKARAAQCLDCRLQWVRGGCCGAPPSCLSPSECMAYLDDGTSRPETEGQPELDPDARVPAERGQPARAGRNGRVRTPPTAPTPKNNTRRSAGRGNPRPRPERPPEIIWQDSPMPDPADRRPEPIEKSSECGETMADENARHEREMMKNRRQREEENARYARTMRSLDLRRHPIAGMTEEARHQSMLQQLGRDASSIDKRHERCVLRLTSPTRGGPGPFNFQLNR
jgi:hypothetical protein